ncbi:3'(2'),5'-bisphosphate nucleotidase CysQ [Caenimonas koreensis DSM 17982]|uniref:3'(2'),5'-bisphosphate nucleotidase CysQ n=1 Tax=Caenimonas koreensis DSM 17982 TaxID=1121255 RepID=A0A844B771_9BURK|nr:3'(2'),5'-bisphosphate nucleotidase CysQ [Caenimonas koreensis]MRD47236.1 3'(2'),5'-bisphosphate nucleotidase CysQ [Caenimonas koreensis DSM 17982]
MQLTREQLANLCDIASEAGREIMDVYGGAIESWQKDDKSPLTQADLRADAVIRRRLESEFAGIFILSEESVSAASGDQRVFFLVDPLDGTKEFLKRNGEFTVNIALIEDGRAIAGVVYAPALEEMFFCAAGLGAWKGQGANHQANVQALHTRITKPGDTLRVIGSRSHGADALDAWLKGLNRPHEFVAAGSSLKFCRIAEGAADVYPRHGPTSQWDTAAAQAVLEQAGGRVLNPAGEPLRYGVELPVLNTYFIALGDPALDYPALT